MSSSDSAVRGPASESLGDRSAADLAEHASSSVTGPFLVGAVMLALGAVMFWQTFAIDAEGFDPLGPKFFPLVVISVWLVLSVLYLGQHTAKVIRSRAGLAAERFDHMRAAAALVVLLIGYAYVLDPLGYWISTSVFFVGAARAMGSRHLPRDVVIGLALALLVYLSFTRALGVHLPEGVLGF